MNLKELVEVIDKRWNKMGLKYEFGDNRVRINTTINTKTYKDSIFLDCTVYDNGNLCMAFIFDEIEPTMESYELISDFNDKVGYLKAYVSKRNDKKFLAIDYYVLNVETELQVAEHFEYALLKIVNDSTSKHLVPITKFTHS